MNLLRTHVCSSVPCSRSPRSKTLDRAKCIFDFFLLIFDMLFLVIITTLALFMGRNSWTLYPVSNLQSQLMRRVIGHLYVSVQQNASGFRSWSGPATKSSVDIRGDPASHCRRYQVIAVNHQSPNDEKTSYVEQAEIKICLRHGR